MLAISSSSLALRVAPTVATIPPPGRGDLGVAGAGQATAQLVATIAGEHGVGVRIDEARDRGEPASVELFGVTAVGDLVRQLLVTSDEQDAMAVGGDRGVGEDRASRWPDPRRGPRPAQATNCRR